MGELQDVLKSISDHTSVEIRDHYVNPSIGRGVLMMNGMQAPRTIWIVNNDDDLAKQAYKDLLNEF